MENDLERLRKIQRLAERAEEEKRRRHDSPWHVPPSLGGRRSFPKGLSPVIDVPLLSDDALEALARDVLSELERRDGF